MFIPLKNLLSSSVKKAGIRRQIEAVAVIEKFNKVIKDLFGQKVESRVRAISFKNGVLTVSSTSSVLIQEMHLKQEQIIKKLNKKLEKEIVKTLRFRI